MYENPLLVCDSGGACVLRAWIPRRFRRQQDSLYTHAQVRDALNTFLALIILGSDSADPFCLNRMGSNPLEPAFGRTRPRCRGVNTMERLTTGFSGDFMSTPQRLFSSSARHLTVDVQLDMTAFRYRQASPQSSHPRLTPLHCPYWLSARDRKSPRVNLSSFKMSW
jgi:hypothetical protein